MDGRSVVRWNDLMTTRTNPWPAGVPCWADLMTPDVEAAIVFYGSVLGWEFAATEAEYGGYTIAQSQGRAAGGIGPAQVGARTAWTLYFASDDTDATAAAITANGGSVLGDPADVGPLGRMCIAADPTGAVFGVWQAGEHLGAEVANEPGGLTWEDLRSTDPETAIAFYAAVFGLEGKPMPMASDDYRTLHLAGDDAPIGGAGGMMGAPDGTPSHWLVYFAVGDCDASVAAAVAGGGTSLADPWDTPFGRMAPVTDPWGATFFVAQLPADVAEPQRA